MQCCRLGFGRRGNNASKLLKANSRYSVLGNCPITQVGMGIRISFCRGTSKSLAYTKLEIIVIERKIEIMDPSKRASWPPGTCLSSQQCRAMVLVALCASGR